MKLLFWLTDVYSKYIKWRYDIKDRDTPPGYTTLNYREDNEEEL
jgi:hypothetical protein